MLSILEFRGYSLVSEAFADVSDSQVQLALELAQCLLCICVPDECRIAAWSYAVGHVLELTVTGCGLPLTGVSEIQNQADRVKFAPRGLSELESTRYGAILKQILRQHSANSLYFGVLR
jgi:hypothetical protein